MTIQALIFDFDGLILDTETAALESWRSIYAEYGHDLSLELWKDALGRAPGHGFDAAAHLATLVNTPIDRVVLLAERQARKRQLCETLMVLPGVRELLEEAHKLDLPCAIASSSDREWVEGWLRRHDFYDAFACVRTSDDVAAAKPAPDLFLSAASCLGVPPANCLVFEDSPNGVLAAKRAGLFCVAVPNALTGQLLLEHADLRLGSLAELPLPALLEHVHARRTCSTAQLAPS